MSRPHDLRLLVPALSCWAAVIGFASLSSWLVVLITVGAVLGASFVNGPILLRMTLVCLAMVGASSAWRIAAVESSPIRALAAERQVVVLTAQIRGDPRTFQRHGRKFSIVRIGLKQFQHEGANVSASGRMTAFMDGAVADLTVGRTVTIEGRLEPADASDEVATINVSRRSISGSAPWWWTSAEAMRAAVRVSVARTGPGPRGLIPALVDGDESAIDDATREDFRRSGLTHLLAVSGTNLTIVLASVLAVARLLGARRPLLMLIGLLAVVAFCLVARPDPSVIRAAAMGLVGLAALGVGAGNGSRSLAVAVIVLLTIDPWLARSAGFVLSVCATGGILWGTEPLAERLRRWLPRWCAVAIAVPTVAQIACTPMVAAISGEISLIAVAANILAGPVVAPATIGGLLGGLGALIAEPVGTIPGHFAAWCGHWILFVARRSAGVQGANLTWEAAWWALIPLMVLVAGVVFVAASRPVIFIGAALGLTIMMWRPPSPGWPPPNWIMIACDVGQGDATVVSTGPKTAMVIDAGPDPALIDRCLKRADIRKVQLLVFTHDHADHVDGWSGVQRGRRVEQVLLGASGGPSDVAKTRMAKPGETFRFGRVKAVVLWPEFNEGPQPDQRDGSAINNQSVVISVQSAGSSLLLTGDIEPAAQDRLLAKFPQLRADVVKMPHHGSSRQSTRFFSALGARLATISAGQDNSYGHPATAALDLLDSQGIRSWRTDLHGDIAIVGQDGRLGVVTQD